MKKCAAECGLELPLESFSRNKNTPDGLMRQCKACNLARVKAWQKANPEKVKYTREKLLRRHGLTIEDWQRMQDEYGGKCFSCQDSEGTVIDHDHKCCPGTYSCGKCVRGLLCSNCNTALGLLKEDEKRLLKLLEYTRR